jgi:hypothetical protein
LELEHAATLTGEFESDWYGHDGNRPRFVTAAMDSAILNDSAALVSLHGLRAYDAVQLSTARRVREIVEGRDRFATFDKGLRRASLRYVCAGVAKQRYALRSTWVAQPLLKIGFTTTFGLLRPDGIPQGG